MTTVPPGLPVSRLGWEPLHEVVYRELRAAIMSARFAPGQPLAVRRTAQLLGVSPMPVRAALARLVAERALAALPNGTTVVPVMTRAHFVDLVDARLLLEGEATERAARKVSPEELAVIGQLAKSLTEAAHDGRPDEYLRLNQEFKFAVYGACGSAALEDLIERLWLQVGPFMHYYSRDITGQAATDEQAAVLDALRRGDGQGARRAMERDIRAGAAFLLEAGEFAGTSPRVSPDGSGRTRPMSSR